jgi:hypothetical protein
MASSVPNTSAVPDRIFDAGQLTFGHAEWGTNLDIDLTVDCNLETPL